MIVLSDGRTILPHDASVRLDGKLGEGAPQVADDQLWMWRSYVSMARGLRVDVGDDVATAAQVYHRVSGTDGLSNKFWIAGSILCCA